MARFTHWTVNGILMASLLVPLLLFCTCFGKTLPDVESEKEHNASESANVSFYEVSRTTESVVIDGRLEEMDWRSAFEAHMKDIVTGDDVPLKTTIKFLWDDEYLYIGTYCEDPDIWTTFTNEDDPLWGNEVVEFFFDPDGNGRNYIELEINSVNAKVDLLVINAGKRFDGKYQFFREWDFEKLRSAVNVEGDGLNVDTPDKYWTCEIAVPFDDLWEAPTIPPEPGDIWRLNAYRLERPDSGKSGDYWVGAFSPVSRNNGHTPWLFGKIQFK